MADMEHYFHKDTLEYIDSCPLGTYGKHPKMHKFALVKIGRPMDLEETHMQHPAKNKDGSIDPDGAPVWLPSLRWGAVDAQLRKKPNGS